MTETTDKPKVMSERALKTRAKIMDATRAFIVREGVGRLSIDKIVKESGTSKGAFLYHFKNRKALFCALVEVGSFIGRPQRSRRRKAMSLRSTGHW